MSTVRLALVPCDAASKTAAFDVAERQAQPDVVAVGAGGGEADQATVQPDPLVAGGVGVGRVDRQQGQATVRLGLACGERRLATDEVRLVEVDEPVQTGHCRRVGLGELRRPDAVALLEPQAVDCAIPDQAHAEWLAHFTEGREQCALLSSGDGDLVSQLTGE